MRKMLINAPARGDLDSIDNYLRLEKRNQQAADHFASEVHKAYDSVFGNPLAFHLCPDRHLAARGYRPVKVMRYIMLYRYDEQADIVHIIRFFHELQDYANILLRS